MSTPWVAGADPGFQIRGGALKKIAPSGGRREKCWGISCEKSRFYATKSYFLPILGGRAPGAPTWIRPWVVYITAHNTYRGRLGRDRIAVEFATTYAISVYHH